MKKMNYEAPKIEQTIVRFETNIMSPVEGVKRVNSDWDEPTTD